MSNMFQDPDEPAGTPRKRRKGSLRRRYCGGKPERGEHDFVVLPEHSRFFAKWEELPKHTQDAYGTRAAWAASVKEREARFAEHGLERIPRRWRWIECRRCGRKDLVNKTEADKYSAGGPSDD